MFICNDCKSRLPCGCGKTAGYQDGIIQLTDMPDLNIADGDKYIGYEHIGKYYSGYTGTASISEEDNIIVKSIIGEVGEGIILDLGCGDGHHTIPLIANGAEVIGGDISNGMMKIIREKAEFLKLDTSKLTLCRMNAYDIPLPDCSIDVVITNSMLHLNSNPERIVKEVHRVLKQGGKYICFSDLPGSGNEKKHGDDADTKEHGKRISFFHQNYFRLLNEEGLHGTRYSWHFNRDEVCEPLFESKNSIVIELPRKVINIPFSMFYNRMKGRGFSDQTAIPQNIHEKIFQEVERIMEENYGKDYMEISCREYQEDLLMTVYIK